MGRGMGWHGKAGNMGGTTNTKGHLKNHMETYYFRCFLKYKHVRGI